MTDTTAKPLESRQKVFYNKKIHDNPEFYQREKVRVREFNKKKYAEDPEFREKQKERARINYKKKKEACANIGEAREVLMTVPSVDA